MNLGNGRDLRDIVAEGPASIRPDLLERWISERGISQTAQRVFWFHWNLGFLKSGWVSQVPLRTVAGAVYRDVSSVTRAYQELIQMNLVVRTSAGRKRDNPFQQAPAFTEVVLPREVLEQLLLNPWVLDRAAEDANFLPRPSLPKGQ